MRLSELQRKDIVNIKTGKKIGKIIDVEVNDLGSISYMVVEANKLFKNFFNTDREINISFNEISKIGEDVILVDIS